MQAEELRTRLQVLTFHLMEKTEQPKDQNTPSSSPRKHLQASPSLCLSPSGSKQPSSPSSGPLELWSKQTAFLPLSVLPAFSCTSCLQTSCPGHIGQYFSKRGPGSLAAEEGKLYRRKGHVSKVLKDEWESSRLMRKGKSITGRRARKKAQTQETTGYVLGPSSSFR